MSRKWSTLAVATAVASLFCGMTWAADDESPLAKLMEKVQAKNIVISKGTRTSVAYKKAQKEVSDAAAELAKLGKEAREDTGPAKTQKKPQGDWVKLMDDFIAKAEDLSKLTAKSSTDQAAAKTAYRAMSASCTSCHNEFRVDE